ncbi:MAG: hypothetical protein KBB01_05985 [Candidatus Omnitrophica bacterium]|jgi:cell division ATPase FtsA|nr:hypothetical protein [Candidatus Omnitrophota bacterium]
MKGACAIVLDCDKAFISYAALRKRGLNFFQETEINSPYDDSDIADWLKKNSEVLKDKISSIEKKSLFNIQKVYLQLPWGSCQIKRVQEAVTLGRKKKIASGDIASLKKYLENKFLDWDDYCVHNIIFRYEIEGKYYFTAPLGIAAKKIKADAILVLIKDKIYQEVEGIFDNLERNFSGFVLPQVSLFSSVFKKKDKIRAVVSIDYAKSHLVTIGREEFIDNKEFPFGLKQIIEALAEKFILPFNLAQEVFFRYFSFQETPFSKEVTIKKEDGYLNLSIQTLNSFIKDYLKTQVQYIAKDLEQLASNKDLIVSFIGRLNSKEGFYGFLQSFFPYNLKAPLQKSILSSSYGCLRYGLNPFLENDYKRKTSFLRYILGIYKEYF